MELPGAACIWASYSYSEKVYVKLATPIVVALCLVVPVVVAWIMVRRAVARKQACETSQSEQAQSQAEEKKILWKQRYDRTVDVFWNNIMFWLFLIYPGTSLTTLQTFICRQIYRDTYLLASMYKDECPWGGQNLEMWRLNTWQPMAVISFIFVFVYPLGVPLLMLLLMRYNGVPKLARQKIGDALVSTMIVEHMKSTTTASSQRLAAFIGVAPAMNMKTTHKENTEESVHEEFDRRTRVVFVEIFPDHEHCTSDSCAGHQLPDMPLTFLKELGHPEDMTALTLAARKWFDRADADGGGCLQKHMCFDDEDCVQYLVYIDVFLSKALSSLLCLLADTHQFGRRFGWPGSR